MLEPTKKAPSALSLIPHPNHLLADYISHSNRSRSPSSSALIRKSRRQSTPSSLASSIEGPSSHTRVTANPILFRAEPESPVSLHEWQRSINDRIKTPFPTEFYQPCPSPPPPVPKIPKTPHASIVNMYNSMSSSTPNPARASMPHNTSHRSLSQSVTSNLSSALSSVTNSSARRKSRVLSPSDLKRLRDADQTSSTGSESTAPALPTMTVQQQGHSDDEPQDALNAEKVLEQALRFHQQRRNQQRLGGPGSLKSKTSSLSTKDSTPSSPAQAKTSPAATHSGSTMPAIKTNRTSPPNLSIASFEVLIKEIEQEEDERKRKRQIPIPQPLLTPSPLQPQESLASTPIEAPAPTPLLRMKRPNPLNEAKRRSTGSILFSQPLSPTFPLDKENSFSFMFDRKVSATATHPRRISVASFGSERCDSKRSSVHEVTFNFVDWSGIGVGGSCAASERRASRDYNAVMLRSNSVVSSVLGGVGVPAEFDESKRLSMYNFGRRGSVF